MTGMKVVNGTITPEQLEVLSRGYAFIVGDKGNLIALTAGDHHFEDTGILIDMQEWKSVDTDRILAELVIEYATKMDRRAHEWGGAVVDFGTHWAADLKQIATESGLATGPGTVSHRYHHIMTEFERRFPNAHSWWAADPGEPKYFAKIDALIAASADARYKSLIDRLALAIEHGDAHGWGTAKAEIENIKQSVELYAKLSETQTP
jgi:hypothetical protein